MSNVKRVTPYQRLFKEVQEFVFSVKYPQKADLFFYSKSEINSGSAWRLDAVYQRTMAAQSLGYEVIITADGNGLQMSYRKKPDYTELPFPLRP